MTFTILFTGENADSLALLKEAFSQQDCQVIKAPDTSLALFLARKNLPDLILCQINRRHQDSQSFLYAIQSDPELRTIPFLFFIDDDVVQSCQEEPAKLGMDEIIHLPMPPKLLWRRLQPLINKHLAIKEIRPPETPE